MNPKKTGKERNIIKIDYNGEKPLFIQIAEGIEDAILLGAYPEESQIPSTTEISVTYKINPATALKGINLLVDQNIIYKKRGIGMFVSEGATNKLKEKRKNEFFDLFVVKLTSEAKRLGFTLEETFALIEKGYEGSKQ